MTHSKPVREESRNKSWLRSTAFAAALSGFAVLSPLYESTAYAQEPQAETTRTVQPVVRGQEAQLTDGANTRQTRLVFRQQNLSAEVEVEGPARVNLRFYPVTSRDWFNEQTTSYSRSIDYSVGAPGTAGTTQTHTGTTSPSTMTSANIQDPLGIGTPIDLTVTVPAGRQVITVRAPNGFLEVLGAEAIAEARRIAPEERRTPPVENPPVQPPVQPVATVRRPLVQITGERTSLYGLGTARNTGDVYDLNGFGNIYFSDNFALSVGAGISSVGLSMQNAGAQTDLRTISGRVLGGLSYFNNQHYFYLLAGPGGRGSSSHIAAPDGRTADETNPAFDFTGMIGYQYGRYFAAHAEGGNAPFNPFTARLYGAIPFTWAGGDSYPDLSFQLRLLRNLRPREDGNIGSFVVDENDLHMRWTARVPIYRIPGINLTPYAFVAPEYIHNLSGEGNRFNFYVGPSLRLAFDQFSIDASAGWEVVNRESAVPLVLLNITANRF